MNDEAEVHSNKPPESRSSEVPSVEDIVGGEDAIVVSHQVLRIMLLIWMQFVIIVQMVRIQLVTKVVGISG